MMNIYARLLQAMEVQKQNLRFPYYLSKNCGDFAVHKCDFSYESMNKEDFKGEPIEGSMRVQMLK